MLQISFKINPEKSKREIDGINIGSGESFFRTRPYIFVYAQEIGDSSVATVDKGNFILIIRSFHDCVLSNDLIRQFQLTKVSYKKECVLFGRIDHQTKFRFRGIIQSFDSDIFKTMTEETVQSAHPVHPTLLYNQCILCLDNPANCTMYPCGHVCLCSRCKQSFEQKSSCCPLCKKRFTVCFRIYL